jgi:hypothetical protein
MLRRFYLFLFFFLFLFPLNAQAARDIPVCVDRLSARGEAFELGVHYTSLIPGGFSEFSGSTSLFTLILGAPLFGNKEWQKEFYSLLQKSKKDTTTFENTLSKLFEKTGKIESSFASKLVATIDPKMPVIDSIVLKNLKFKLPYSYDKEREIKILKIYQTLIKEFSLFLKTESGKYLVEQFAKEYPTSKISKTKMLDLILWQTR